MNADSRVALGLLLLAALVVVLVVDTFPRKWYGVILQTAAIAFGAALVASALLTAGAP